MGARRDRLKAWPDRQHPWAAAVAVVIVVIALAAAGVKYLSGRQSAELVPAPTGAVSTAPGGIKVGGAKPSPARTRTAAHPVTVASAVYRAPSTLYIPHSTRAVPSPSASTTVITPTATTWTTVTAAPSAPSAPPPVSPGASPPPPPTHAPASVPPPTAS